MNNCPLCNNIDFNVLYNVKKIPVFQNKVYISEAIAKEAKLVEITLASCNYCGFIFNKDFIGELLNYDSDYNNQQEYSDYFKDYLNDIIEILKIENFKDKKIIEIGCGKGHFLEMMLEKGFHIIGFDPAYEGDNKCVIKDYFNEKYKDIEADLIILRHTLEHIEQPFKFLHSIARANKNKGMIFIEVPTFDWIVANSAFWDICYEHCNYFTIETLSQMFNKNKVGEIFNGQYIYLLADLEYLKKNIVLDFKKSEICNFSINLKKYYKFLEDNKDIILWGAGAKGSIFANIVDQDRSYIKYIVDINPKKQNKFIGGTGHKIFSPEFIKNDNTVRSILVMNRNYLNEIKEFMNKDDINYYCVEEIK